MGQKVNPIGFRIGVNKSWDSRWFAKGKQYADYLHEDFKLRDFLKKKLKHAGVAKIEMERAGTKLKLILLLQNQVLLSVKKVLELIN